MQTDVFDRTKIAGWETRLGSAFSNIDAEKTHARACEILARELGCVDDRGNRMIGVHIRKNILPGYACYRALLDNGADSASAVAFVEAELCRAVQRMSRLCRKLSHRKCAYTIVKATLKLAFRFAYPPQGWRIQNKSITDQSVSFEMTTCLYCEELSKRAALELCPAFCQTDHASYDPLSPSVVFTRKTTLSTGGDVCDFCFTRGQQQKKFMIDA